MPLQTPNLDDRTFAQLVDEARARIARTCPEWTDLSPHDPGMVLVEVFAWLTEAMIYRLNRVPEKAYVEFLKMIGVTLHPPSAARARVRFSLAAPGRRVVEIPRGTRVMPSRSSPDTEPVVFVTTEAARIAAGSTEAEVLALHCEVVEAELVGVGTGLAGQSARLRRPPVVAPTGDPLDLVIGVEAKEEELNRSMPARVWGERSYRLWKEVSSFANAGPDDALFVADRVSGVIQFAPAARLALPGGGIADSPAPLAAVPGDKREIRAWYRRGGGPAGNVAAGQIDTLKDPIPGLRVTNVGPATGGRAVESVANALVRGPQEIHGLHRAVTARDYELIALRTSGAVARARAFTRAAQWVHASPGAVDLLVVPDLPEGIRGAFGEGVTEANLLAHQTEDARRPIEAEIERRRPLGTACRVSWVRCKPVRVRARVVVEQAEDVEAIRQRALQRLWMTISPLPTPLQPSGWRFGEALRASHIYDILLREPGVRFVVEARMVVEEVPKGITALVADAHQPHTWYAGSGTTLFRSTSAGEGWEVVARLAPEEPDLIAVHPQVPGLVAVVTQVPGQERRSRLRISRDCLESWEDLSQTLDGVHDIAWGRRDGLPILYIAADSGLFELLPQAGATPLQVTVDPARPALGFHSVSYAEDPRGGSWLAVAAVSLGGVFLSSAGGRPGTFGAIGLTGVDVRLLRVQSDGPRRFLWAASYAAGGSDPGRGLSTWELGVARVAADWVTYDKNWDGGSCLSLAFEGSLVHVGTHRGGVLTLDSGRAGASWQRPSVDSNLPLRERDRLFQPIGAVAVTPAGGLVLAGSPAGIHRRVRGQSRWEFSSAAEFIEKVPLPATWLFCSGEHELEVVVADASE